MFDPTQGPARTTVSARDQLDQAELGRMQAAGTLVIDDRRRRPLWFDGRFLAARDLTREQNYFLTRQADLGQATGTGVVWGLMVTPGGSATSIQIQSGHGITGSGELVVVQQALSIDLADVAAMQPLDTAFGLMRLPSDPLRNRSGLFVVALRPVEFTANPIASYPTSITDIRSVSDGDIIEGAAISLIPYVPNSIRNEADMSRARAAHEIFLEGSTRGSPVNAIPLAMIAVERDVVQWIDPFLVRREAAAAQGSLLSLGFAPRALREAYLLQYQQHLADVLAQRPSNGSGQRFAASDYFLALPAAGPVPVATINPTDFTQSYFPAEVDVALSIVPEDELTALLEESLLLPPIDLTLSGGDLRSTSVLMLVPVPRATFPLLAGGLPSLSRPLAPAAPGLVAQRRPLEALQGLMLPRFILPVMNPQSVADAAWSQVLNTAATLWYVRRRNLQYKAEVVGLGIDAQQDDMVQEQTMLQNLDALGLKARFTALATRASAAGNAEMVALLSSPKFATDPILGNAIVHDLEGVATLNRAGVLQVAALYSDPHLGDGLQRLENAVGDLKTNTTVIDNIAQSGAVPTLDLVGRLIPAQGIANFATQVVQTASTGSPATVAALIDNQRGALST
jgi:hypothetical protein